MKEAGVVCWFLLPFCHRLSPDNEHVSVLTFDFSPTQTISNDFTVYKLPNAAYFAMAFPKVYNDTWDLRVVLPCPEFDEDTV